MFARHGSRCIPSSLQNQKYKVKTRHYSQHRLSSGSFISSGTRLLPQRLPLDLYWIAPLLGAAELLRRPCANSNTNSKLSLITVAAYREIISAPVSQS